MLTTGQEFEGVGEWENTWLKHELLVSFPQWLSILLVSCGFFHVYVEFLPICFVCSMYLVGYKELRFFI
jgi:hypothetical protein